MNKIKWKHGAPYFPTLIDWLDIKAVASYVGELQAELDAACRMMGRSRADQAVWDDLHDDLDNQIISDNTKEAGL